MRTSFITPSILSALVCHHTATAMKIDVEFNSHGTTLAGHLHLPESYQEGQRLPAVVVTGAWTTVKEQMPSTYAAALAEQGFAALVFDFRGWGESPEEQAFLEDPGRKTADILSALAFLSTRPEVDSSLMGGLGICASSGYMSDAAFASPHLRSLALVAPWLHNAEIVEAVYGGKDGVAGLIAAGREAAAAASPVLIEAASTTNEDALMFQAPYYTEKDRGLIEAYDNQFNVASWEPWLTYDAVSTGALLRKPTLLVHSEKAAIPQGAKAYAAAMGGNAEVLWLDDVSQFDFYDRPAVVSAAVAAVAEHFKQTMAEGGDHQRRIDEAAIRTTVEAVGVCADQGNFEALEKLYADEVEVDYTSLAGGEVETKSPQALMTQWASTLPGFDRTRHQVSEIEVELEGREAIARARVAADHYLANLYWRVEGSYRYRLAKTGGLWQITAHQFNLEREEGTREVFALAVERAGDHPCSYLVRRQTEEVVKRFLASLESKDMEAFAELWAEDAVQHMPYAPDQFPTRVAGKENLLKHYAQWPATAGAADFTSKLVFYPMADPEMTFVEFEGLVDIIPTGRQYKQSYGGLFHVKDWKIQLFREYFNPQPFVYAFGLEDGGGE